MKQGRYKAKLRGLLSVAALSVICAGTGVFAYDQANTKDCVAAKAVKQECSFFGYYDWEQESDCILTGNSTPDSSRIGNAGSSGEFCGSHTFDPPWYCIWVQRWIPCGGVTDSYNPPSE